ncbi:MAG TPA: hypothetical protein VIH88_15170 [Candidatus Acidoferrales bacterium]
MHILRMKNYATELETLASECTVTELNGKNMQRHHERGGNTSWILSEAEMCSIVEAGGGRYVGVMREIPGKMEAIVLFISLQTRTTLGLPSSRLTVAAVREQLAESDAAFSQADSK